MRRSDLDILRQPYPEGFEPCDADAKAALGVKLPRWAALQDEIFGDLTEQYPYGIGWWAPFPGTSRRLLISDQLYCCVDTVAVNMTDASLHWLEYLEASDRDSARLANSVELLPGGPVFQPPRARDPYEQLCPDFIRIHQAGIVRAIASTLDCLAGAIIGIVALPLSILKADFKVVRTALLKINAAAGTGANEQAAFAASLEKAISAAGPKGWLEWVLDLRNMLVHRGHRIEMGQILPIEPVLLGPNGRPVLRAHRASHLPRDPARSDVEVFLDSHWDMVLQEEAQRTLRGVMDSAMLLLETAAVDLTKMWRWRRNHPRDLPQPKEQWKNGASIQSSAFTGYAPGSLILKPSPGVIHPAIARRLHAAALDDSTREQWADFD